jgi:hypothetical protein
MKTFRRGLNPKTPLSYGFVMLGVRFVLEMGYSMNLISLLLYFTIKIISLINKKNT